MTDLIPFTNSLFWKTTKPFLTANEADLVKRIEEEAETFEVLNKEDFKYKLYLDIDVDWTEKEWDEDIPEIVEDYGVEYIGMALKVLLPDLEPRISIATSHSQSFLDWKTKKEKSKISVRYWVSNIRANKEDQVVFVKQMNKWLFKTFKKNQNDTIWKYIEKTSSLFDEGIYDKNRKMRCVNTSKPDENRPLELKFGKIEDTIISGFFDEECIDLPEIKVEGEENKKSKKEPEKKKSKKLVIEEDETTGETEEDDKTIASNSSNSTAQDFTADINAIREVFKAILEIQEDYFDKYPEWIQLGFICFNQTKGSDDGCDLFFELTNLRKNPAKVSSNTCSKQFNTTQKERKKDDKLYLASLYKWLRDLDPNHPLLKVFQLRRLEKGDMKEEEIRLTQPYLDYRKKFEKYNFKLNNPVRYAEEEFDKKKGKFILLRNEADFKLRYCDIDGMPIFLVKGGLAPFPKKFHEIWINDPKKRKYSKIKFDPTEAEEEEVEEGQSPPYNAFTGWINDKGAEPIKEEESAFLKVLKWLLLEDKCYEYYKCWLAGIIQHPDIKTKVAPILFSKTHGSGKNTIVDGSVAIIGKSLCGQLEGIEDITRNFNAHLCNKLLIYGDEICAKARNVSERLKAVITRPYQNLEKKNIDPVEVEDFTNYLFTTNNENNIKVEEGDRRFAMMRCREQKQNHLSIPSYAEIADPIKISQLYSFFKNYKQSEESIKKYGKFNIGVDNAIETQYKLEMIYEHKPAYIQVLYKNTMDLVGRKFSSAKLYEYTQEWAKKHYCSSNYTAPDFSKSVQPYIKAFYKKSNTGSQYQFPANKVELYKHLFLVDEKYYRYIHQLEEDFTPEFKDEEAKPLGKDLRGNIIWNLGEDVEE